MRSGAPHPASNGATAEAIAAQVQEPPTDRPPIGVADRHHARYGAGKPLEPESRRCRHSYSPRNLRAIPFAGTSAHCETWPPSSSRAGYVTSTSRATVRRRWRG